LRNKKKHNNIVLKKNTDYLIRGIIVDNLIIRFDEIYLKKYKKPYIKYLGNVIDISSTEECLLMLSSIKLLENSSLKKHGRQKKKDNENFYNSCSIIVKASADIKCVNIKLFNNGKITLTGSKCELDGFYAASVLLEDMKKEKDIFPDNEEKDILESNIINYKVTLINSDFNTNFKIDLLKLLTILNIDIGVFTKFNPEKYRGLIIGYFWNTSKKEQDGKCNCKSKCNGKGCGYGDGQCKKVTISIFKSGSIIITGGRIVKQIEDAYKLINDILKKHYHNIIKLSILDYINELDDSSIDEEIDEEKEEYIKKIDTNKDRKIIKIKKIIS
jgi:TATA-box binding protein (TBP) (component of TFIID and TFIIIB)